MEINRQKVVQAFQDYSGRYDITDEKVRLKVEHTERVAALCEQIAESLKLSPEDVELAWLIGYLHDIGRFEQLRRFGTFNDAESIDHAAYGADILFHDGKIREFVTDGEEDELIRLAVASHSLYRLPEDISERQRMFCQIIRDADKIDILKVNVDFPLEEIYNVTSDELYHCTVTEAVMESFKEEHATLRSLKRTPVDHVVGHLSLVFELVYPISLKLVVEQGYLDRLLDFPSQNKKTQEQFVWIRQKLHDYMERQGNASLENGNGEREEQ
ncbi:MAG: HD domain-containing protein [Lachnospiraceae bacterium]